MIAEVKCSYFISVVLQNGEEVYSEMKKGDLGPVLKEFFGAHEGGLKNGLRKQQYVLKHLFRKR